ncbi:MAG: hypothetical protein K9I94_07000 [Bacteroidales bacterium]|nr:hypothetical protein [Bacteroidales bacterium]
MRFLSVIFVLLVALTGCQKDDESSLADSIGGERIHADYLDFGKCFYASSNYDSVVIQNESAYKALEDSLRANNSKDCSDASLPNVNFNDYTLIGKWTGASGCSAEYEREVIKDNTKNIYLYKITVKSYGLCQMLISNMNWALIPKVPPGWKVEFEVNYEFSGDK